MPTTGEEKFEELKKNTQKVLNSVVKPLALSVFGKNWSERCENGIRFSMKVLAFDPL